jgi:hypothetical protein
MTETYLKLKDKVIEIYGIDVSTRCREGKIPIARGAVSVILVKYFGHSIIEVGRAAGLDHSTVIYHMREHEGRYLHNNFYASLYDTLCSFAMSEGAIDRVVDVFEISKLMKIAFQ